MESKEIDNTKNKEVIVMKPMSDLDKEIQQVLNEEANNIELLRELNEEFAKKGFNLKTISTLFNETKTVDELNDMERIAFAEACQRIFKKEGREWANSFITKKYFSQQTLIEYETYMNVKPIINEVHFKNCIKIDDYNYRTIMTGKQVYDYMNNMLILYNKATQRASKLKKVGDKFTRTISLNKRAVREIADAVLDGTFEETEIILNLRMIKGKKQQFEFKESVIEGIGDITIIPEYDRDSDYMSFLEIVDGYHRISGVKMAMEQYYQKTGKWLDCKIGVKLIIADVDRALRVISQTFKRTDTNKDWLKAIEKNDTTKFVDEFIKNSRMLKEEVENSIEECKAFNVRTYKSILVDTVKKLDIAVNDPTEVSYCALGMAKNIDLLIGLVDRKIKRNLDYKYLNYPNMYIVYTKCAYLLYQKEGTIIDCEKIIDRLTELSDEEIKSLKLNVKNFNFNNIFNLINEV